MPMSVSKTMGRTPAPADAPADADGCGAAEGAAAEAADPRGDRASEPHAATATARTNVATIERFMPAAS